MPPMAQDRRKNERVFLNGIDLSEHIKDITITEAEPSLRGLKSTGPITLEGVWDDGRSTCGNCGDRFVAGPEGVPVLRSDSGVSVVACPACVIAVLGAGGLS